MILTEEKIKRDKEQVQEEISRLESALIYCEVYERLRENEDFKKHQERLKMFVKYHEANLSVALSLFPKLVGEKREDLHLTMVQSQVRKEQIQEFIDEPDQVIAVAKNARTRIAELEEKLKDYEPKS